MPRPTWTTNEQGEYLTLRQKDFADSQVDGSTKAFFASVTLSFVERWPRQVSTEEIDAAKGDEEAAMEASTKKLRNVSSHRR